MFEGDALPEEVAKKLRDRATFLIHHEDIFMRGLSLLLMEAAATIDRLVESLAREEQDCGEQIAMVRKLLAHVEASGVNPWGDVRTK